MDIFWILDPDPHENLCGSETLQDRRLVVEINYVFQFLWIGIKQIIRMDLDLGF